MSSTDCGTASSQRRTITACDLRAGSLESMSLSLARSAGMSWSLPSASEAVVPRSSATPSTV